LKNLNAFDYIYNEDRIALDPLENRQDAKMLVFDGDVFFHKKVGELTSSLTSNDLLIFNNTKVIPCRLKAKKRRNFGSSDSTEVEVTLNKKEQDNSWSSFCYPGKKVRVGDVLYFENCLVATIKSIKNGLYIMQFNKHGEELLALIGEIGEMPIPPYIKKKRGYKSSDLKNYQTPFAKIAGSVAAPTASLHFNEKVLHSLEVKCISSCYITLHVSAGTFVPIKTHNLDEHIMHSEFAKVDLDTIAKIKETKMNGGRIIAIGTTVMRVLESDNFFVDGQMSPFEGQINTFIRPGHKFKVCSGLFTNFHQPKSTLFVLVNAFIGVENTKKIYQAALDRKYRLFSYGDCCLLFP
jgi:S-adenosylmethionine:tRNA ribosyltransferase-isomerase